MAQGTTEFSALVPTSEYRKFKQNFPQYGAPKWFINTVLREFNQQCEANPSARELINNSIEQMLQQTREEKAAATVSGD